MAPAFRRQCPGGIQQLELICVQVDGEGLRKSNPNQESIAEIFLLSMSTIAMSSVTLMPTHSQKNI